MLGRIGIPEPVRDEDLIFFIFTLKMFLKLDFSLIVKGIAIRYISDRSNFKNNLTQKM